MRVMTPRESSFVRCAAAVVKRIQEEPIETKSRTQFRFVSDGYQEEEFRFRDYYGTIVRLREKLTALPEVINCITLLSQERNRIREYKLSDDAGAAVTVNETNIRPWVADDLWRIIGKGLDRHQSERVATRQYLSWFRTVIRHSESPPPRRRIVPVFGLSMNQTLRFGSAVLSPFSAQEKSDLLSGPAARSIDPLVLMGAQAKIESTKAEFRPTQLTSDAEELVFALQMVSDGRVIAPFTLFPPHDDVLSMQAGTSLQFGRGRHWDVFSLPVAAPLTTAQISHLKQTFSRLHNKTTQAKHAWTIHRLSLFHYRDLAEDQVVDLVVALEACLLPKNEAQLKFRFGLVGATLLRRTRDPLATRKLLELAYDVRSNIVHSGRRLHEMKKEQKKFLDLGFKGTMHSEFAPTLARLAQDIFGEVLALGETGDLDVGEHALDVLTKGLRAPRARQTTPNPPARPGPDGTR